MYDSWQIVYKESQTKYLSLQLCKYMCIHDRLVMTDMSNLEKSLSSILHFLVFSSLMSGCELWLPLEYIHPVLEPSRILRPGTNVLVLGSPGPVLAQNFEARARSKQIFGPFF